MPREIEGLREENRKLKTLLIGSSEESNSEESVVQEVQKTRVRVVVPLWHLTEARTL
jgi:hypothetical protein